MAFDQIDEAFHYISNAPPGERRAWVQRSSGRVLLASTKAGFDERPEGSENDPDYVAIPHRHALDPGRTLLLEFVHSHCPQELGRIEALFARSGAFRLAKDHFRRIGLLESWQVFETQQLEELLRQWCVEQDLPV